MTLVEAIKRLEKERKDHHSLSTDKLGQALVLGIEASEHFRRARGSYRNPSNRKLPSETLD
jgi:hypothetical protein